jgi:hypothetical protein
MLERKRNEAELPSFGPLRNPLGDADRPIGCTRNSPTGLAAVASDAITLWGAKAYLNVCVVPASLKAVQDLGAYASCEHYAERLRSAVVPARVTKIGTELILAVSGLNFRP